MNKDKVEMVAAGGVYIPKSLRDLVDKKVEAEYYSSRRDYYRAIIRKDIDEIGTLEENTLLLIKAYKNLAFSDFEIAFKNEDCGAEHLWRQYTTLYRCNLTSFLGYLNTRERKCLLDYILIKFRVNR